MLSALLAHINCGGTECSEHSPLLFDEIDRPTDIQFPLIRNQNEAVQVQSATVRHHKPIKSSSGTN